MTASFTSEFDAEKIIRREFSLLRSDAASLGELSPTFRHILMPSPTEVKQSKENDTSGTLTIPHDPNPQQRHLKSPKIARLNSPVSSASHHAVIVKSDRTAALKYVTLDVT